MLCCIFTPLLLNTALYPCLLLQFTLQKTKDGRRMNVGSSKDDRKIIGRSSDKDRLIIEQSPGDTRLRYGSDTAQVGLYHGFGRDVLWLCYTSGMGQDRRRYAAAQTLPESNIGSTWDIHGIYPGAYWNLPRSSIGSTWGQVGVRIGAGRELPKIYYKRTSALVHLKT